MISLDTIGATMTPEQIARILNANFDRLGKVINVIASNVLLSVSSNATQTTTSSTYSKIKNFTDLAFSTSGGMVEIAASLSVDTAGANGQEAMVSMYLDGNAVQVKSHYVFNSTANANGHGNLAFLYKKKLSAGTHSLTFKWKVSGSTMGLNTSYASFESRTSEVFVTEILTP